MITVDSYTSVNLKYDKVKPRVFRYNYLKHKYAVYMYLDPFESGHFKYEFKCCGVPQVVESAYKPVYVGKLESPMQYRMNQHLNNFVRDFQESKNQYKRKFFDDLVLNIQRNRDSGAPDTLMPQDLDEYKKHWIIILKSFDSPQEVRYRLTGYR